MQSQRKIKRVQPLIKMKKSRVDEEAAILEAIRLEKIRVVQSMKDSQRRYMEGVENLNQVRVSRARSNLETIEAGLDYVKAQWYKLYKDVQEIERKEKAQISQLLSTERELKSVEKLQERYQTEMRKELGKAEQRVLDETALRRFVTQNRDTGR